MIEDLIVEEEGKKVLELIMWNVEEMRLPELTKLVAESVHIDDVRIEDVWDEVVIAVVEGAMLNRLVRRFRLSCADEDYEWLSLEVVDALARYVICADWLESFTIDWYPLELGRSIADVVRALRVAGNMRSLCLSGCLEDSDAELLAESLRFMPGLEKLCVSYNWLGARGLEAVFGALEDSAIVDLDVGHTHMDARGFTALARLLRARSGLKVLCLDNCDDYEEDEGEEEDYAALADLMGAVGNLERLSVTYTVLFSAKAGWALGRAMRNIRDIKLNYCDINDECALGIAHGLRALPDKTTLRSVNFYWNCATELGVFTLADALAEQTGIECLLFYPGSMSPRVYSALARLVTNNRRLNRLSVSFGQGDRVLADPIANSLSLRSLCSCRTSSRTILDAIRRNTSIFE